VGDAKNVLEQAIEAWNERNRDRWETLYTDDVVYEAPGGQRILGLADLKEQYFDALLTAAPDRVSRDVVLLAEGEYVIEQARYIGTHTGPLRSPGGVAIPATGKPFDFPFVAVFRVQSGKISSIRIYYDQMQLLMQLGLIPQRAPADAA
jgi:steroid delta-isomerase-like uncharacterized protein